MNMNAKCFLACIQHKTRNIERTGHTCTLRYPQKHEKHVRIVTENLNAQYEWEVD